MPEHWDQGNDLPSQASFLPNPSPSRSDSRQGLDQHWALVPALCSCPLAPSLWPHSPGLELHV